ncbi:serine palmitoyltransferase 1-like [Macrosteles quadrilineatus]|uniref:serine palmitoyltransferase 1-like n=1 Tax=Macrosteles quadrilineatus TaxID=74068 RepID=UPI0023E0CA3F|nr:serine palmitoyltransferase 1-like [Macrosteles quadrilineatus]
MNDTNNSLFNMKAHVSDFPATFEENLVYVLVEILLFLGTIWIILKKKNSNTLKNLTKSEEEDLITKYTPEDLVPEISSTHHALNPRVLQGKVGYKVVIDGVERLNFATHDYLGFMGNEEFENETKECISVYGVGACGPRGFYGTSIHHLELEQQLAQFLGTEDSIMISYGFSTIASTIPAYAKKNDIVFVDEKCNYAIQQGLRASKSEIKYFKHNDMQDLERILEETKNIDLLNLRKARKSRRHMVVEGIYFNTGEICDLPNVIKLCKKYKLRIFMDESISFGVLGKTGRGITEYFGIPLNDVDLIMGSFEFAFASVGGFCAGSRFLVDHLQAAALGYMFSASLPPLLVKASLLALNEIQTHPEKLEKLQTICNCMHDKLINSTVINKYFHVSGGVDSPVHVLTLRRDGKQDDQEAIILNISDFCFQRNIVITAAARLPESDVALTRPGIRITTNINHTESLITNLILILEEACYHTFNYRNSL